MQPIYVALITAVGVAFGGWLTFLVSRRKQTSDAGMQMIDQHQEDIAGLRGEVTSQRVRIEKIERVARVQGDYIGELRRHITDQRPPPPPPYPEGLIT